MKIGLQIPIFKLPGGTPAIAQHLAAIARSADENGFASLWVMDHFFQIEMVGPAEDPMLEGYATLSYLAAHTQRVKLGTLVTGAIYRHPGILIKTVTTLDVLSGGRAYLGIGAGWFEREALGLGVPYPSTSERFEQLEETLQIAKQMWSDNNGPYEGKHNKLAETLNEPPALSQPHPPILIGGMGENKTLRLVAQYADACNLFAGAGPEVLRQKLDTLRRHCENVGRDYDEIEKTTLGTAYFAPDQFSPADIIANCRSLAEIGIQHAIFNMPDPHALTPLETFGREIIPAVAEL